MINSLTPVFSKYIPRYTDMKFGELYISREYMSASHMCPCGCTTLIVTPLSLNPEEDAKRLGTNQFWKFIEKDGLVTLEPSLGNYQIPCKSHYNITENKIVNHGSL